MPQNAHARFIPGLLFYFSGYGFADAAKARMPKIVKRLFIFCPLVIKAIDFCPLGDHHNAKRL